MEVVTIVGPRPSFYAFFNKQSVSMFDLARASGKSMLLLWNMLRDQPVCREDAVQILGALGDLCGRPLSLADIAVVLERRTRGDDES